MVKRVKKKAPKAAPTRKRAYISQGEIPKYSLSESLRLVQCLVDDFAGKSAAPHQLAMSVDVSPTSSSWRELCGSSIAYGLTEGGCNAAAIKSTPLGRRIVAPTEEGDDVRARVEASLRPRIMREFFDKYNKAKLPSDRIAHNVLDEIGVPSGRAEAVFEIIKRNGEFVGVVHQTKTGPYVAVDTPAPTLADAPATETSDDLHGEREKGSAAAPQPVALPAAAATATTAARRVYISHGTSREIVQQIKEILTFGKFEPIVSVERESTAIPVPEKVFQDLRGCIAGVIHVMKEGDLLDSQGNPVTRLNENVLIEIGAAIALYKRNFVLLVEKGLKLPSNLQGLYKCEYEGNRLGYEATMKLLKTFNEFKFE